MPGSQAIVTVTPDASLVQRVEAMAAAMPVAAVVAPPPVTIDSAVGAGTAYARADHTHESRLQARRIQVTPDANGRYVYVFPKPYAVGVIPIPNATAETPTGVSYRHDVSILENSTSNTQTTLVITRQNQSITTGLLGAVLSIFSPVTSAVWVNIMSRAPS